MDRPLRTMEIKFERDIVRVHQMIRRLAEHLKFDAHQQSRLATATSEICRNAFKYAGGGKAEFVLCTTDSPSLCVTVSDRGPGIPHLSEVFDGEYHSSTGMGLGLIGARRLMDSFEVESTDQGTKITMCKWLPRKTPLSAPEEAELMELIADRREAEPFEIIRQQNTELLQTLEQLRAKQEELNQSNAELAETNRGVVALYRELDDKSQTLKKLSEVKSRFLSHMSHELRTPVYSILALSRILLDHSDGELNPEQQKQVGFVRRAAENLQEMIDDLLDLAKIESGRVSISRSLVDMGELFSTLRGIMRPLLPASAGVQLQFEIRDGLSELLTDEGKLAQILRNLVSNAIKYTEAGEIQVTVEPAGLDKVRFRVRDSGVGIPLEDQTRIFEEFAQVEGPHQNRLKGTGLGLPVSRKLAELLGGSLSVESTPGVGSSFTLILPTIAELAGELDVPRPIQTRRVLVIDDDEISRYLFRDVLRGSGLELIEAHDGIMGLQLARQQKPVIIFLDLLMPGLDGFGVLEQLRQDPYTNEIPVVINSTRTIEGSEAAILNQGAMAILRKSFVCREDSAKQILSLVDRAFGVDRTMRIER